MRRIIFWETTWSTKANRLIFGSGPSSDTKIYNKTENVKIKYPAANLFSN
jgi:hypothetical protein